MEALQKQDVRVCMINALRRLRVHIEVETGVELDTSQAALLADVCAALGLREADTVYVVGLDAYQGLVDGRDAQLAVSVPMVGELSSMTRPEDFERFVALARNGAADG